MWESKKSKAIVDVKPCLLLEAVLEKPDVRNFRGGSGNAVWLCATTLLGEGKIYARFDEGTLKIEYD